MNDGRAEIVNPNPNPYPGVFPVLVTPPLLTLNRATAMSLVGSNLYYDYYDLYQGARINEWSCESHFLFYQFYNFLNLKHEKKFSVDLSYSIVFNSPRAKTIPGFVQTFVSGISTLYHRKNRILKCVRNVL